MKDSKLSEQNTKLVLVGMLDAATAVVDDRVRDVAADQEHPAMAHAKSE